MVEKIVAGLLHQFERGKISRRQLVQQLAFGVAAVSAAASAAVPAVASTVTAAPRHNGFRATGVNHISFGVADYARTRDFYADLLGMQVSDDDGRQCSLSFGESVLIARNAQPPDQRPLVDHMAYSIENWDRKAVEDELRHRGLDPQPDMQGSFKIKDPDGYVVQIASKDFMKESV